MAERLPLAPEELEAEEHAALEAINASKQQEQEKTLQAQLANVPSWKAQLTGRGITVGLLLGAMFTIVVHKLNLGVGIIPSLNIAAGLLSFCSLKIWQMVSKQLWPNNPTSPFGAQECNVVQTFITACSSVAFTGGFGSYLTAMDRRSYNLLGGDSAQGNREEDIYEPSLYRVIPYLLCTSVIGVFMLVALRKTMIIDYDLTYPSGTATGLMIDSFFTQRGQETAGKQLTQMGRFFGISVAWDAFKWLFSGADCAFCRLTTICGGFEKFPIFGMVAAKWTFYANFTPNIIGAGMICPHIVNLSMVLGAILTWGFLWPYIASKEGIWYDAGQDDTSFAGLFGYKVFLTIALLMGDGLYSLSKVMTASVRAYCATRQQQQQWMRPSSPSCTTRGSTDSDAGNGYTGHDAADEAAGASNGPPPDFWGGVCWHVARVGSGMQDAVFGRRGSAWLGYSSIKANEGFNVRGGVSELPSEGHPTHDHGHTYTHAHGHTHAHTHTPGGECHISSDMCTGGSSSSGASWMGDYAQRQQQQQQQGGLSQPWQEGQERQQGEEWVHHHQQHHHQLHHQQQQQQQHGAWHGSSGGKEEGSEGDEALKKPLLGGRVRSMHSVQSAGALDQEYRGGMGAGGGEGEEAMDETKLEYDLRRHVFVSDVIPNSISIAGYLGFGLLGTVVIPFCYSAVKWYYVITGFLVAPLMALPVSFGCGLTDWDVSSMMGKLAIFAFAAWASLQNGGVVAGLAMAGVVLAATSTSATLMQDFRTGFIVLCAPKAMFAAQLIGALCGALLAPLTFALFWATGKVGEPEGPYPAPYAAIFRAMAIFGTQGLNVLPQNCDTLMLVFFLGAIAINIARDLAPPRVSGFIPIPMAMAIPFVLGAYIAVDMGLGSLILAIWEWKNAGAAELLAPAVASGLIVGDGVFSLPLSLAGMLNIQAPFCMAFGGISAPTTAAG